MQITVNVNKFRSYLATVTPVIGKSFLPVLNNVLIKSDGRKVSLCAGNGIQMVTTAFECDSIPGEVTVPARKLLSLLDSLPQDEDICFESDDSSAKVTLTVASGCFTLLGHPAVDYPLLSICEHPESAKLADGVLAAMIDHCRSAVNKDESRPALAGMYLHFEGDRTTAVATDGKRMAVYSVAAENVFTLPPVIIPSSALNLIAKIPGDLELIAVNSMLEVKSNNMSVVTKLISGSYPNYKSVLPQNFKEHIEIDGQLLSNAVKLVSPLVDVNQSIMLAFESGHLELSANSSSIGSASYRIPVECGSEQRQEVNLNPAFLLNALNGTKEKITVKLNDTLAPMQIELCDDVFTVLMPLRRK